MSSSVDQRKAAPLGDNVGRDKHVHHHHSQRKAQIEGWLDKLNEQLHSDQRTRELVDALQYYFQAFPYDDIIGLENKLDHAGRTTQKRAALRRKEAFSKLLAEWQAFPAAQEIFAYFLARMEAVFETEIVPLLSVCSVQEVDAEIKTRMIDPILDEMGCGPFMLNHLNVSGMMYWLAEQCYVRWHS